MTAKEVLAAKEKLGISVEAICGEAGICVSTYYKVVRGGEVNPNTAKHLAAALRRLQEEADREEA